MPSAQYANSKAARTGLFYRLDLAHADGSLKFTALAGSCFRVRCPKLEGELYSVAGRFKELLGGIQLSS